MMRNLFLLAVCFIAVACSSGNEYEEPHVDTTPHLDEGDSLALITIYQKIGPWRDEWDFNDITTWNGVKTALDEATNKIRVVGFEVYYGNFHDEFPKEFCQLTELRTLAVWGGHLEGQIPEEIGNLKHLYYLSIAENDMTGSIPESIGELKQLYYLDIRNAPLTGKIPESIGNLVNLEYLYITGTKISGNLPIGIANMKKLKRAFFMNNRLTGTFPIEVLRNDIFIECNDNDFTELPFEVWNDSLDYVPPLLLKNRLSGTIPDWVKSTKKWHQYADVCIGRQQENYGYTNYEYPEYPNY